MQAFQPATFNPALFLAKLDKFGVVETGHAADLVLLEWKRIRWRIPAADRSTIRRGDAVLHWREQSLQRPPTHRHETARPWPAGIGRLPVVRLIVSAGSPKQSCYAM